MVRGDQNKESRANREPAWFRVAEAILSTFDARASVVLTERVLALSRKRPTLGDIGDRFGISRERVRQIEGRAWKDLVALVTDPSNMHLLAASRRIRDQLGPVFTTEDLVNRLGIDMNTRSLSPAVLLVLWFAGPYELLDRFYRRGFIAELSSHLSRIDSVAVPLRDVRSSLRALGVRDSEQLQVLADLPEIRVFGNYVVGWKGSLADKAASILSVNQRLMTADEIHAEIGEGRVSTLKNYLAEDPRFQRRGPHTWGLAEWGGESYQGIAVEMADELRQASAGMPVARLKRVLDEKFGIKASSVEIMSSTHPMFDREGSWVRLRPASEPYTPDSALEEDPDCVVIAGGWAFRHVVSHDTLRGSGSAIPEPFAAHLGVLPGGRKQFHSQQGAIQVYWPAQTPAISSLRRATEALEAKLGDMLFIREDGSRFDFVIVRRSDLEWGGPIHRLMARLGQPDINEPWLRACAVAVGLPAHARAPEIDQLLDARGDREVLRLFRSALHPAKEG